MKKLSAQATAGTLPDRPIVGPTALPLSIIWIGSRRKSIQMLMLLAEAHRLDRLLWATIPNRKRQRRRHKKRKGERNGNRRSCGASQCKLHQDKKAKGTGVAVVLASANSYLETG